MPSRARYSAPQRLRRTLEQLRQTPADASAAGHAASATRAPAAADAAGSDRKTVAVTGASSGIGLEFVRQYAAAGWEVLALCRSPASAGQLAEVSTGCREATAGGSDRGAIC